MQHATDRRKLPVSMLAAGIAVALASPAFAQQAAEGPAHVSDMAAVTVTGYRESLQKSLDEKRYSIEQVDAIFAEDIGKFPDQNLAEALQRIPGVAITRDSGEGRQISLRGLGADFTRTQLNGMEVLTNTSSGLDSRSSVSR